MNINTIYLLTGAAGFLGINICTQLIERGEPVSYTHLTLPTT